MYREVILLTYDPEKFWTSLPALPPPAPSKKTRYFVMKGDAVRQFLDLEAQVDEDDEYDEGTEDEMDDFIVKGGQQEGMDDRLWPRAPGGDSSSTAAHLQQVADGYRARAAEEHRAIYSDANPRGFARFLHLERSNPRFGMIARAIAESEVRTPLGQMELCMFRVPDYKTEYFVSRLSHIQNDERYAGWIKFVFTLKFLLGRVFVLGPDTTIPGIRHLAGIKSYPVQIPRSDWASGTDSTLFVPWMNNDIPPQSWVKIWQRGQTYFGDIAYVMGSARDTDCLVLALVPRIRKEDKKGKGRGIFGGRKLKVPRVLFNPDAITRYGQSAIEAVPFGERDFASICKDLFFRRVCTHNPDTQEQVLSDEPVDFSSFDWAPGPIYQETAYLYKGHLFYRGLLIQIVHSYCAMEKVTVPAVDDVVLFAESGVDSARSGRLLSQLHWQIGDRVCHAEVLYSLTGIEIERGSVSAIRITDPPSPLEIELNIDEVQRIFFLGDGVVVLAGLHKGLTGLVLREDDGILHILTNNDDGNYVSVPSQWVSSFLAPQSSLERAPHLQIGDVVKVVRGQERLREGRITARHQHGKVLTMTDLQTNETLSIGLDDVEKVTLRQHPVHVKKERDPWDTRGRIIVGDFVVVMYGDSAGKEGFVKETTDTFNIVVEETRQNSTEPLLIVVGNHTDVEVQASTFAVSSLQTFCYDRVQVYDIVQVQYGPMKGRAGHVVTILPNGYLHIREITDGFTTETSRAPDQLLNIYRPHVVIQDRLCIGDNVRVKYGPMESRRGTVKEFRDEGMVVMEQTFGHIASNRLCQVHRVILDKIDSTFTRAVKHEAVSKRVQIIRGPMKGYAAYVLAYNYVRKAFLVNLDSGAQYNFEAADLVYLDNRRSLDSNQVLAAQPATSSSRQHTPIPDGPLVSPDDPDHETWNVSSTGVISDDTLETLIPQCFLTDPILTDVCHDKHIRVALGPKFGGGNRIGYTKIPLKFDHHLPPSKVSMYWTDNKAKWQQGDIFLQDLKPARPTKSKVLAVVLSGDRKGQIVEVVKVTKADGTVLLATGSEPQKELATNVCIVENHLAIGCTCSYLPKN